MKPYQSLLILTFQQRIVEFKGSLERREAREVAKILVAMVAEGDCKWGEMREHAAMITDGKDIRKDLQSVYELVKVLHAVLANEIEISLAEFDSMKSSMLALLAPFLTKEELKPHLARAVEIAKTGTANMLRDLKRPDGIRESKRMMELREKLTQCEARAIMAEARAKAAEERLRDL
jgi:hypothetical protein